MSGLPIPPPSPDLLHLLWGSRQRRGAGAAGDKGHRAAGQNVLVLSKALTCRMPPPTPPSHAAEHSRVQTQAVVPGSTSTNSPSRQAMGACRPAPPTVQSRTLRFREGHRGSGARTVPLVDTGVGLGGPLLMGVACPLGAVCPSLS